MLTPGPPSPSSLAAESWFCLGDWHVQLVNCISRFRHKSTGPCDSGTAGQTAAGESHGTSTKALKGGQLGFESGEPLCLLDYHLPAV